MGKTRFVVGGITGVMGPLFALPSSYCLREQRLGEDTVVPWAFRRRKAEIPPRYFLFRTFGLGSTFSYPELRPNLVWTVLGDVL